MDIDLKLPMPSEPVPGVATVIGLSTATRGERQAHLLELMLAGHMPARLRSLAPVSFEEDDATGSRHRITLFVTRDYLSVGTDADSVRVPLDALAAQGAADALGCMLPTTAIVDRVWHAAQRLTPQPWGPPYDESMLSAERAVTHSARIDAQVSEQGLDPAGLLAGHKKDVVLSNRLLAKPGAVAIYGWHRPDGAPIQPLSLVHEASYADYSHGVRLVHGTCTLDGVEGTPIKDVLRDPTLARLVSTEGTLRLLRHPRA